MNSTENKLPYSLTFLGTGTSHGIPVISCKCAVCTSSNTKDKRFRSSVLIESGSTKVVIDTGPDFRQQMLRENINWLDAILLTHEHRDHIAGIDDIRVFNYRRKGALTFHCYPRVEKEIREAFAYIFANNKYPGIPEITFQNFENDPFLVGDLTFTPLMVMHYKLQVAGFRIGNLAYITDVSAVPDSTLALLHNLDILVLGCLRREPHIAHYHLEAALEIAKQIGAKQTYFIHMSHDIGLHDEVEAELPQNVHLCYDGLKLNFS